MSKKRIPRRIPADFWESIDGVNNELNYNLEVDGSKKRVSKDDTLLLVGDLLKKDDKLRGKLFGNCKKKKMGRKYNKRGNIQDIGFGQVVVFMAAMSAILIFAILAAVNTEVQSSDALTNTSKEIMQFNIDKFGFIFDSSIPLLLVGIIGGVAALASVVRGSPAFAFIGLIIVGFYLFIGAIFSNMFLTFSQNSALSGVASTFTMTNFVMDNFPLVILAIALIVTVLFYAKRQQ